VISTSWLGLCGRSVTICAYDSLLLPSICIFIILICVRPLTDVSSLIAISSSTTVFLFTLEGSVSIGKCVVIGFKRGLSGSTQLPRGSTGVSALGR